ncbi:hypothetical protein [Stenotrophomonas sp. TWI809]|uniref:hypothetical protein n=1 Tax=Stenotrophomonas sp. TWI809 TaxID=3136796 RepID=UPI0032098FED
MNLLRRIVNGVLAPEDELIQALRSQSSFAAYSRADQGVFAMSLNHQKSIATDVLGGFSVLDRLRKEALASVALKSQKKRGRLRATRKDVENSLLSLKRENQILREDLFLLQRAFDIRCSQARRYASAAGEPTVSICSKEQLELDTGLSLRRIIAEPTNVVHLRGKNAKK